MEKVAFVLLAITGGCAFGIQSSINGAFGKRIGIYESSFISCVIATLMLFIVVLLFGKGNLLGVTEVPKWQLIGGVMGAFIVTTMVITVPRIGGASAVFGVMFGQMFISLLIDNYGFFSMPIMKFDWYRCAGILFMLIGLILIFKNNLNLHL